MSQTTFVDRTRFDTQKESYQESTIATSLLDIALNPLILDNIVPYLGIPGLLSLASTNQTFGGLVYKTPRVFRYLNLTELKTAQFDIDRIDSGGQVWRNAQLDENVTEDE